VTKSGVEGYYHYYYYYCDGKEESFSIEEMFSLQRIISFHGKFLTYLYQLQIRIFGEKE
jgi:hypothetical protein